ncbi:hypothetical protein F5Y04DRAFT_287487 [Hypomontagnella monticulosa]|nr:hypothetical protein F5Y04DRAFT_287487 [Hypomontagnella monticulosa]
MGSSNDSGERLLGSYTEGSNYREELRFKGRSSACSWLKSNALSLLALIVLLYVAVIETINISLSYARSNNNEIEDQRPSLVKGVLRYEERPEWSMPQYPWNLEPSDTLDTAWEDLLYALNVRISNNELSLLNVNQTNRVQVTGGSDDDYVGVLGVYHHLHCLNNIRRLLRWDYYGPKLTGEKHMEGFSPEHSGTTPNLTQASHEWANRFHPN